MVKFCTMSVAIILFGQCYIVIWWLVQCSIIINRLGIQCEEANKTFLVLALKFNVDISQVTWMGTYWIGVDISL